MIEIVRLMVGLSHSLAVAVQDRSVQGWLRDFTMLVTLETAVDICMTGFHRRLGHVGIARSVLWHGTHVSSIETAHVRGRCLLR